MKMVQIVGAVQVMRKLVTAELPLKTAYKLSQMVGYVNKELEFYNAEKAKIQAKYNPDTDTLEKKTQAQKEMEVLLNFDIAWEHQPVKLKMADLGDIKLSVFELQSLDGFVEIDFPEET